MCLTHQTHGNPKLGNGNARKGKISYLRKERHIFVHRGAPEIHYATQHSVSSTRVCHSSHVWQKSRLTTRYLTLSYTNLICDKVVQSQQPEWRDSPYIISDAALFVYNLFSTTLSLFWFRLERKVCCCTASTCP